MVKNNFFDRVEQMNDELTLNLILNSPRPKFVDGCKESYVVNLDVLSHGVKSDLNTQKVGSDTRSYFEYKEGIGSPVKTIKMK